MANLRSASVREAMNMGLGKDINLIQVAGATETLLKGINIIDYLVKPKKFSLTSAYLRCFESKDNGFSNHRVKVMDDNPVDEISEWQIIGTVREHIVNIVVRGIFHTHQHNRSGNHEFTINGKPDFRPEYGGITVDDIWQESGIYKQFSEASSIGIIQQNRQGKIIKRYH